MIDWLIEIDGTLPDGWNPKQDGCWFPDFPYQEYLLPQFDIGGKPIDEYDRTEFNREELIRLKTHLIARRNDLQGQPKTWNFVSATETQAGRDSVATIERKQVLAVLDKTLRMIDFALACGGRLVFRGD